MHVWTEKYESGIESIDPALSKKAYTVCVCLTIFLSLKSSLYTNNFWCSQLCESNLLIRPILVHNNHHFYWLWLLRSVLWQHCYNKVQRGEKHESESHTSCNQASSAKWSKAFYFTVKLKINTARKQVIITYCSIKLALQTAMDVYNRQFVFYSEKVGLMVCCFLNLTIN